MIYNPVLYSFNQIEYKYSRLLLIIWGTVIIIFIILETRFNRAQQNGNHLKILNKSYTIDIMIYVLFCFLDISLQQRLDFDVLPTMI